MAVSVAEYFGQRVDVENPIQPIDKSIAQSNGVNCPFMDSPCSKLEKGLKPVCSVRKPDGTLWIVCEHRLCATPRTFKGDQGREHLFLNDHQRDILWKVANTVYRGDFNEQDIHVAREVSVPVEGQNRPYKADYVMRNLSEDNQGIDRLIVEMQGGGETGQTKRISDLVDDWENNPNRNNAMLTKTAGANTIESNAWRRQQEQFLVKGNVVTQTNGKIVFVVGTLLYDYLERRFKRSVDAGILRNLQNDNWTLCIVAFKEIEVHPPLPGSIKFEVDPERMLFTNYNSFVQFLTNQGAPCPEMFTGEFENLNGNLVKIS